MAFNRQTFQTRALTAIVFVIVMLGGLFWNEWSFFILFSIIHFGCWDEYQQLIGHIDYEYKHITAFHRYGIMLAGWCILLYFTGDSYGVWGTRLQQIGGWAGLGFLIIFPFGELIFSKQMLLKNIGHSLFGLVYISLSWGLMIDLRSGDAGAGWRDQGIVIPCGLIFSIWINDTMAYIVGSLIGRTPLSSISPKKTWEGTIGGGILCVVVITISAKLLKVGSVTDWLIISTLAVVAGTMGDLLESKLKRLAGVKDSGSIMPGHGGFLDRFDSMLIAIPFVWLYVRLFM